MNPDYKRIIRAILDGYSLEPWGIHGLSHWARVLENGLKLAETTGADPAIIRLFALFHDSRRLNDETDRGHGRRGAEFASTLLGDCFDLSDEDFGRLYLACEHHTDTDFHNDPTIQTCWDADRLDLLRVWKKVDPAFLGTAAARDPQVIDWAERRSREDFVPEWVKTDWLVDNSTII